MMGSRKEEERNEKIIRGLLKLPPNRRCINCNSLGPQYVCTNFWTFVCMTCSGIHREFTHRVKSVSMSKFTVQEVEALQNGGNQRAKETYLRDWDYERQRLPASSNVDRVREFIKHVYVDKKYAGTKPADKPPRDLQRMGSYEDESRRASSYHSFSQSPPYDFQYEERRYGKQGAVLARRPGSDRGIYAGKMSNFVFSPTRSNDRMSEDRFANEGSVSRLSDYSVSSGGDLGRPGSGVGSPNFQKESGASSPSPQPLGGVNNQIAQPQRTMSLGTKSFFGKPFAVRSNSLPTLVDELSEPEQSALPYKENGPVLFPPTSAIHNNMGFAKPPALPQSDSAPIDLFQLPSSSGPPLDLFNVSQPQPPSKKMDRHPQTFPPTLDLFSGFDQNQPVVTAGKISPKPVAPKNEGWATFDNMHPVASTAGAEKSAPSLMANGSDLAAAQGGQVSTLGTQMELQAFQNVGAEKTSSVVDPWHADLHNPELQSISTTQAWNVFDNSSVPFPVEHVHPFSESKLPAYNHSAGLDMHIGQPDNDATRRDAYFQPSALRSSSHPEHPMMEQRVSQAPHSRSTNPFELPFDSELEADKMFLDMTSLQSALPNDHLPSTFLADASQSWFPQDPVMNYMPSVAPQGGLPYAPGQVLSPPLGSIPAQGPVASIGGNPFA